MRPVLVTQRVWIHPAHGERRDCLDQRWAAFLHQCGLYAVAVPNHLPTVRTLLDKVAPLGVILSGGDDLVAYGGTAPERDEVEFLLIEETDARKLPLLGVCRGMQALQHFYGVTLMKVTGHVQAHQDILVHGHPARVNSYHTWGTREALPPLESWAVASDVVVKAVRDPVKRRVGVMWHPERMEVPRTDDIALFRTHFGVGS